MKLYDFNDNLPRIKAILLFALLIIACSLWMTIHLPPLHYGGLMDVGHAWIPSMRATFGYQGALWIWYFVTLMLDIIVGFILIRVILLGKNKKLLTAIGLNVFLHGILWHLTLFPIPVDIVWQFPIDVGAIATPYDFWPSGHVAHAVVIALYCSHQMSRFWKVASWLYVILMIYVVLATRAHYSVDVVGGFFMASSVWYFCKKLHFGKQT